MNKKQQTYHIEVPIPGLSDLYVPTETAKSLARDIVDVLLDMGKITLQIRNDFRQLQSQKQGTDPEAYLLEKRLVANEDILEAKANLYDMELRHIDAKTIDKEIFEKSGLDINFIRCNNMAPVAIEKDTLVVATSDPANVFAIEEVKTHTQLNVKAVVCGNEEIEAVCNLMEKEDKNSNLDDIISDMTEVEVVQDQQRNIEDIEKMAGQSPVIKFVNYIISNAVREGASDIHVEPKEKVAKIRYRIDGVLFELMQSPLKMHPAVVSRIKIMSNLDISERRLPQDGKISVIVGGRGIDLRISMLPTNRGEKVVIRVLDSKSIMRGLEQLGMESDVIATFSKQISLPHGILLVTGPTGSGKSTTLYSALNQMDGEKLNVSTVEDPVEYELGFCNQVQVNENIGLDFAAALRSLLRQDPDVIMIGEIRDNETARIAVQAALTGHLVLSTLHTNDAASSITRLVNIGIDPYLIAASLNAVLAQRLVRKICPKCKQPYKVSDEFCRGNLKNYKLGSQKLFHGAGCKQCRNSGYTGRIGIYELLVIDDKFRDLINKDPSVNNMRRVFQDSGADTLFQDGIKKAKAGLTTIEEVLRVTEVYGDEENKTLAKNTN